MSLQGVYKALVEERWRSLNIPWEELEYATINCRWVHCPHGIKRNNIDPWHRGQMTRRDVSGLNSWLCHSHQSQRWEQEGWLVALWRNQDRPHTSLEWRAEWVLLRLGMPYAFQYRLDGHRLDFGNPTLRLGVEADGVCYHSSPEARSRDIEIDERLGGLGWSIVRWREDETDAQWLSRLAAVIKE